VAVCGSGRPKLTVTGYGSRRGSFQRNRPFSKLKMLPHTPSSADRDDRRLHVLHDALEAAPERQQLADARDLALGEDADHLAGADGVAGGLQRLDHFARALFGGDGDDARMRANGLIQGFS
jgi:hypothetical protein